MSVLLSAYYPEGIVFAADKNATVHYVIPSGRRQYVESGTTKVLTWPRRKAVVGFVGLCELASLQLDEWMRIFIAKTRELDDLSEVATRLRDSIQRDFDNDFRDIEDVSNAHLIIHLGGFRVLQDIHVPVMYHIWNHRGIDPETGNYCEAVRKFNLSEDIEANFKQWPDPHDYPTRIRQRLQRMIDDRRFLWFNNGYKIGAFNAFKAHVWASLWAVRDVGLLPAHQDLTQRVAYCQMAVALYGSFFEHHVPPEYRIVGGGVDASFIPWPD